MTFISRRSPWLVPAPVDPAQHVAPSAALPRLVHGAAWRARALAASLGHGLGRVPGGEPQRQVLGRIEQCLRTAEAFVALGSDLDEGLDDLESLIQVRLSEGPLPAAASWAEVAIADLTFGAAMDAVLGSLEDSAHEGLNEAARRSGGAVAFGPDVVEWLAEDEGNRDCMAILLDRWTPAAIRVHGRPRSPTELPLLEARIKVRSAEESLGQFLSELDRWLNRRGLWLPDAARMGVEGPVGWSPRRAPAQRGD